MHHLCEKQLSYTCSKFVNLGTFHKALILPGELKLYDCVCVNRTLTAPLKMLAMNSVRVNITRV